MFRNYLLIALRNIRHNKLFSFINISGLSIGLACCFIILLYVRDEFSYDRFHRDADKKYRIALNRIYPDTEVKYAVIPHSVGPTMLEEFPEVTACTRLFAGQNEIPFTYGDKTFIEKNWMLADSNFFEMFSIELLEGDPGNVLTTPNEMIITESTARKYFGDSAAVGKALTTLFGEVLISGVCADVPDNSHMTFDLLGSLRMLGFLNQPDFVSFSCYTYIKLQEASQTQAVRERIPELIRKHAAGQIQARMGVSYDDYIAAGNGYDYYLQGLRDIHLHSDIEQDLKPNGNYSYVIISISIAIFLLIIASINFMNLTTARSVDRAREVGIRKVVGSEKAQLIRQFLIESIIITLISLLLAIFLVELILPQFNRLIMKNLSVNYLDAFTLPVLLLFALIIGILSGSYPAFVLSSYKPTSIIKGKFSTGKTGTITRNVLVVFQFSISIFLISFTLLVFRQLGFLLNKDMGFDKEKMLIIEGNVPSENYESFKQELMRMPDVSNVSYASTHITGGYYPGFMVQIEEYGSDVITTRFMVVDEDFVETLGLQIIEGRNFFGKFNDSLNVILNQTAIAEYQLTGNAIGATLIEPVDTGGGTALREFKVIGIVNDFHYNSFHDKLNSFVFQSLTGPNGFAAMVYVRINSGNYSETVVGMEEKWNSFFPDQPFSYFFLDDRISSLYTTDQTSGRIFSVFTILAIFIACVGLFGLAAFTAEQRTREIGIRKVQGASVGTIVWQLSTGFTRLILISFIVSILPSIWAMDRWLGNFEFHTGISPVIFVYSGALAIVIAFITISYHAIRSANTNPADILRYE